jgi:hypothetical protein
VTDSRNIFHTVIPAALRTTVVNPARTTVPHMLFLGTGSVRADLLKGPFTIDDAMNVSPRRDPFLFVPDVPYWRVQHLLRHVNAVNAGNHSLAYLSRRAVTERKLAPAKATLLSPGYATVDDFGRDGDDTPHAPRLVLAKLPHIVSTSSETFPGFGQLHLDTGIDVVFHRHLDATVLAGLNQGIDGDTMVATGAADRDGVPTGDKAPARNRFFAKTDVRLYMPKEFTTRDYLPAYVKKVWGEGLDGCSSV